MAKGLLSAAPSCAYAPGLADCAPITVKLIPHEPQPKVTFLAYVRFRPIAVISLSSIASVEGPKGSKVRMLALMLVGALLAGQAEGSPPTSAAVLRYNQGVSVCTVNADADGQQCLADLLEPSDAELKGVYAAALVVAEAQGRADELRHVQTEWLQFVEAQCAYELAQFRGGTGYWSVGYICRIKRNAQRIDDLGQRLNQ